MAWDWAISSAGTAVATWGSDILSLVAIVIALAVAIVEQKRTNGEKLAEFVRQNAEQERREREALRRRTDFVNACAALMSRARTYFESEATRIRALSFIEWKASDDGPRVARTYITSLRALQNAWTGDHLITQALSQAIIALEEAELARGLTGAPPGSRLAHLLDQ